MWRMSNPFGLHASLTLARPPPTTRYPPFRTFVCLCQHVVSFPPHNKKNTKKLALILQSVHVLTLSCCPDRGTLYRPPPPPAPSLPAYCCCCVVLFSVLLCHFSRRCVAAIFNLLQLYGRTSVSAAVSHKFLFFFSLFHLPAVVNPPPPTKLSTVRNAFINKVKSLP